MGTRPARREGAQHRLAILAALLAALSILLAVIAPFVLTTPASALATAFGVYAASQTQDGQRRMAVAAGTASAAVLALSLALLSASLE
jgi:hypothetical protein